MKEEDKDFCIVVFWIALGFLFLPFGRWDFFLFWIVTFGVGGTIFQYQRDKKRRSLKVNEVSKEA